jgi:hypothetical protein
VTVMDLETATAAIGQTQVSYNINTTSGGLTPLNTVSFLPPTQPMRWRSTARSSTEYLVASDLNNQGTVTSGQYTPRIAPQRSWEVVGSATNPALNWAWDVMEVPLTEYNMVQMNPRVRVAPAKYGVYQPLYNGGPTFEWATGRPFPMVGFASAPWAVNGVLVTPAVAAHQDGVYVGSMPSYVSPMDPTTLVALDSWQIPPDAPSGVLTGHTPYTWGTDNTNVGISIYRGLSGAASITIKIVLGLELLPAPASSIRTFTTPAAPNEPNAMQLYYDMVAEMPGSYPASSNFLNAVISAASILLPQLLPHLPAIVSSVVNAFKPRNPSAADQPELKTSAVSQARIAPPPPPPPAIRSRAASVASSRGSRKVKVKGSRKARAAVTRR